MIARSIRSGGNPNYERVSDYENGATGLLDLPLDDWWRTALIDWAGSHSRYGQSTAINALYYATLLDAADIAETVGDGTTAIAWRQKAQFVKEQIDARLYLKSQHRYLTTIFRGEPHPPSPHAQAWALAYGLPPQQEVDHVASALLELLSSDPAAPNVEIYGMYWVLEALGRSNRIVEALDMIRSYWGRLLDLGATTWWEVFDADQDYSNSLSHAWGGAPTWFLTSYVLGARRLGPNSWLVKPSFDGVDFAVGALPLEAGELEVRWEHMGCEERKLDLDVPPNSSGEVVFSMVNDEMTLELNGEIVWQAGRPVAAGVVRLSDGVHIPLDNGTYTLIAFQECHTVRLPVLRR